MLTRPPTLDIYHWIGLAPRDFLEKLDANGNADNRYLTYGYAQHAWYIHMLNAMVWAIWRLARSLDQPIIPRKQLATAPTHREALEQQPEYGTHMSLPLEKLLGDDDSEATRAFLNNNCAFAPTDYPHEPRRAGSAGRNPVLLRRVLAPLRSDHEDNARPGYAMASWVLADTKQSKPVRDELTAAMKAALLRHPKTGKPKP